MSTRFLTHIFQFKLVDLLVCTPAMEYFICYLSNIVFAPSSKIKLHIFYPN
jgi:hypothetical protein